MKCELEMVTKMWTNAALSSKEERNLHENLIKQLTSPAQKQKIDEKLKLCQDTLALIER